MNIALLDEDDIVVHMVKVDKKMNPEHLADFIRFNTDGIKSFKILEFNEYAIRNTRFYGFVEKPTSENCVWDEDKFQWVADEN
jgi:hypothetical protein